MRALTALVALSCLALFVACGGNNNNGGKPAEKSAVKKTWTRDEFRKLVEGKTTEEVIKVVGKPDSTKESGDDIYWHYSGVTVDSLTGRTDISAQLVWKNGVVKGVNY